MDAMVNVAIGAMYGLVGGDGADGVRLYGINKRSASIMAAAKSAKRSAQYAAKRAAVKRNISISIVRTIASSGTGSLARWWYPRLKQEILE